MKLLTLLWSILFILVLGACDSGDGEPCTEQSDCSDGLVCTDYKGGVCLRRCDPTDPNVCGESSWCTISSGPEPGLKCTPPI